MSFRYTSKGLADMNTISSLLSSDNVVVDLDVRNKLRALEEASVILGRLHGVSHDAVLRALWRREQIGSTGLGHGVAVPHARITGIREPIVLFLRTKFAIDFHSPDHKPVSLLFVILVPEHANDEHLKILATVAAMFSNRTFRDRLEGTTEPAAIRSLISDWTSDAADKATNDIQVGACRLGA